MGWSELYERTAARRFITYEDAAACGVPRATLDGRARREGWPARPHAGIVPHPGPALDTRERIWAAAFSAGEGAVVGGRSALFLHGLASGAPTRTELWVPPGNLSRPDDNRRIRRTSLLRPDDVADLDGIPTLVFPWVLRDLAGAHSRDRLRSIALDGRFAGLLTDSDLAPVIDRDRRFRGRGDLAVVAADLAGDGSDSGFEFRTRGRLLERGYPVDPGQEEVTTPGKHRSIDLPFKEFKVGIECLGLRYHRTRVQLDADAERANDIAAAGGWAILQMTWTMQFGPAWERFVARLDQVLRSRGYTPREGR